MVPQVKIVKAELAANGSEDYGLQESAQQTQCSSYDQDEHRRITNNKEVSDSALPTASMILSAMPRTAPWQPVDAPMTAVDAQ